MVFKDSISQETVTQVATGFFCQKITYLARDCRPRRERREVGHGILGFSLVKSGRTSGDRILLSKDYIPCERL